MMKALSLSVVLAALALGGCATTGGGAHTAVAAEKHPEARLYDASRDAKADVDAAILRAEAGTKLVLLVMGANWCHDSRAFAGWMETPRCEPLIAEHYELVVVNVGMPQTKDGHNLDVAKRFDVEVEGTPTVIVLSPLGKVLNAETAKTWRNAATRSEDAIYHELMSFTAA
jgi:hypothetical protein